MLIDPQEQALTFMREYLDHNYIPVKAQDQNFYKVIKLALEEGSSVICENVGDLTAPASLLSLLEREIMVYPTGKYIKFGEHQMPYHEDFRLIMFTNYENPKIKHFI